MAIPFHVVVAAIDMSGNTTITGRMSLSFKCQLSYLNRLDGAANTLSQRTLLFRHGRQHVTGRSLFIVNGWNPAIATAGTSTQIVLMSSSMELGVQ